MNQREGSAVGFLDALQERHDVSLVFRRQLDVAQNDLGKRVDGTHQQRIAPFAGGVEMTDVSAAGLHVGSQIQDSPLVGKGEMHDEFHAQQRDFPRTDPDVVLRQFRDHFLFVAMPKQQGFAGINHHVVAEVRPGWNQRAKFFGAIGVTTWLAAQEHFPRPELANVPRDELSHPCFADLEFATATGAVRHRGPELHEWRGGQKVGRRRPADQSAEMIREAADQSEGGVFFTARPCFAKRFPMVPGPTRNFCFFRRRESSSLSRAGALIFSTRIAIASYGVG